MAKESITGEDLYNMWLKHLELLQNCSADSWDQLSEEDQAVWNAMAEELS